MLKPCFVNTGFSTIAETGKIHTAKDFQQFFNIMWKTFSHFRHTADFWNFLLKFLHYFVHFVLADSAALLESGRKIGYHTTHLAVAV